MTEIPHAAYADDDVKPAWLSTIESAGGRELKPLIRCQCGVIIGLKLHHVHADGTVTASFFHARAEELQKDSEGYFFMHNGRRYSTVPGCGWHVHLKLKDYAGGDFPGEE